MTHKHYVVFYAAERKRNYVFFEKPGIPVIKGIATLGAGAHLWLRSPQRSRSAAIEGGLKIQIAQRSL
jgi:hypothetical protein